MHLFKKLANKTIPV